jgi:hypothetical protein
VPNFTLADTNATGSVDVYNYTGESTINLVIDAFGYFTPSMTSSGGGGGTPPSNSYNTVVTATPNTVPVTTGKSNINTTVDAASNSGVTGDFIEYVLTPSVPGVYSSGKFTSGSCGTLTNVPPPSGASSTGVTVQFDGPTAGGVLPTVPTYKASGVPGTCTITAIEANQGTLGSTTITQLPVVNTITLAASPKTVTEGGITTTTLTATVDGPTGAPLAGDSVTFSYAGTGPSCGTLGTVTTVITNASGQASIGYTSDSGYPPGSFCIIQAKESGTGQLTATPIDNTSATSTVTTVSATAVPTTISTGASNNKSAITVTVTGASNTGIPFDFVTLSLTPSVVASTDAPSSCGTITGTGSPDDGLYLGETSSLGVFDGGPVTYHSSATAGTCTITATEAGNNASNTVVITQTPAGNSVALTASPASITANGITTTVVTATVTGPTGSPVAGDPVVFAPTGIPAACTSPTGATPVVTNASGQASITYTSAITPGFCAVTGTETQTGAIGGTVIDQTSVS